MDRASIGILVALPFGERGVFGESYQSPTRHSTGSCLREMLTRNVARECKLWEYMRGMDFEASIWE